MVVVDLRSDSCRCTARLMIHLFIIHSFIHPSIHFEFIQTKSEERSE